MHILVLNPLNSDYIKQLDEALATVWGDTMCIHTASNALAPTKGALQASLASLVFQGNTKIAHIVAMGGQAMAPNAELMALEMSIATAETLLVGGLAVALRLSLVNFCLKGGLW